MVGRFATGLAVVSLGLLVAGSRPDPDRLSFEESIQRTEVVAESAAAQDTSQILRLIYRIHDESSTNQAIIKYERTKDSTYNYVEAVINTSKDPDRGTNYKISARLVGDGFPSHHRNEATIRVYDQETDHPFGEGQRFFVRIRDHGLNDESTTGFISSGLRRYPNDFPIPDHDLDHWNDSVYMPMRGQRGSATTPMGEPKVSYDPKMIYEGMDWHYGAIVAHMNTLLDWSNNEH